MYNNKKLWSRICRAWDYYVTSEWLFILTMPVIIGFGVALIVFLST